MESPQLLYMNPSAQFLHATIRQQMEDILEDKLFGRQDIFYSGA